MQPLLTKKNDIKIFILYLLSNIGYPLDFPCVNDIAIQDGIVGYFDFAEAFAELIDGGLVLEERGEGGKATYRISEQGASVAKILESDLLETIREISLMSALRLLSFEKKGVSVTAETEPNEDGGVCLTCRIGDKKKDMLRVSVMVDSAVAADRMADNFRDRPELILRGIFSLLSGEMNYLVD